MRRARVRTVRMRQRGKPRCHMRKLTTGPTSLLRALSRMGAGIGDRIVTMLDNNLTPIVLFLACLKIGSIYVPLNTTLKGKFLEREIANADPKVIFAEEDYVSSELEQILSLTHIRPAMIVRNAKLGQSRRSRS